jgi:hypothetical protein
MPKSPSPQLVKTAEELRLDEARENGVPWKQWADPWASWRRSHSAVRFSVRRPPRQDGLIRPAPRPCGDRRKKSLRAALGSPGPPGHVPSLRRCWNMHHRLIVCGPL